MRNFNVIVIERKVLAKLQKAPGTLVEADHHRARITDEKCLSVWGPVYNFMRVI